MLAITLSVALVFGVSIALTRLPFPRDWIVGGTIAANFAFQALIVELCARDLGFQIFLTGFAMLVLDAGLLFYLVAKALAELPNPDQAPPPARSWSSLAHALCALALIGAPLLGHRLSCPIYFWIHRAELEDLVRAEPERPRIALSVTLGFKSHVEFVYDPTHGDAENLWSAQEPFEQAQRLSGAWYARSSD